MFCQKVTSSLSSLPSSSPSLIENSSEGHSLVLYRNLEDGALELKWLDAGARERPYRIDFSSYLSKRQESAKSELVSKAVGKIDSDSTVIDLTAGIGRDSITLAAAGHNVIMVERNPILFALLQDALNRLKKENNAITNRVNLFKYDSTAFGNNQQSLAHVLNSKVTVYLDPMYAEESVGKKAAVKKETQILHRVLGLEEGNNEENNTNLMTSAVQLANQRVVVKRALNAKALSNLRPHHQILGKTQRFDVYLKNQKIVEDKL